MNDEAADVGASGAAQGDVAFAEAHGEHFATFRRKHYDAAHSPVLVAYLYAGIGGYIEVPFRVEFHVGNSHFGVVE